MYFDGKMKTKVDAHVLNFSTKKLQIQLFNSNHINIAEYCAEG